MKQKKYILLLIFCSSITIAAEHTTWGDWFRSIRQRLITNIHYYTPSFITRFFNRSWATTQPQIHRKNIDAQPYLNHLNSVKNDTHAFVMTLEEVKQQLSHLAQIERQPLFKEIIQKIIGEIDEHIQSPLEQKRDHLIFRIGVAFEMPTDPNE